MYVCVVCRLCGRVVYLSDPNIFPTRYLADRPNSPGRVHREIPGVKSPILVQFDSAALTVTFWVDKQGARVDLREWIQRNAFEMGQPPTRTSTIVLEAVPYLSCCPGVELKLNPTLSVPELNAMRRMPCYQASMNNKPIWIKV